MVERLEQDNPSLNARQGNRIVHEPYKVILAPSAKVNPNLHLFERCPEKVIIASAQQPVSQQLISRGVINIVLKGATPKTFLKQAMKVLYQRNIMMLMVEGGGQTFQYFFELGYVDRLLAFVAPKVIGGKQLFLPPEMRSAPSMNSALKLNHLKIKKWMKMFCLMVFLNMK